MVSFSPENLILYAVTDLSGFTAVTLSSFLEKVIGHGITCLQLRDKNADTSVLTSEAKLILPVCRRYNIPLIINDNITAAVNSGADGVHLGQDDTPVSTARKILGSDYIIGASAHSVEEAQKAQKDGADYIGIGAVFGSATKKDVHKMNPSLLKEIAASVSIPAVAIGGIQKDNIHLLNGTGIRGIAVVSAVFSSKTPESDVEYLHKMSEKISVR